MESELGRGSVFHFTVPCAGQNKDRPRYLLEASKSPSSSIGDGISSSVPFSRLLLLTPNEVITRALRFTLESWATECLWAQTIAEGLHLVRAQPRGALQAVIVDHRVLSTAQQPETETEANDAGGASVDAINLSQPLYNPAPLEELRQALQLPFTVAVGGESEASGQSIRLIALVPVILQQRLRSASHLPIQCISTPVKPSQLFTALAGEEQKSPFPSPQSTPRWMPQSNSAPPTPSSRVRVFSPHSLGSLPSSPAESAAVQVRADGGGAGNNQGSSSGEVIRATFAAVHPMQAIVVVEDNKVNQKLLLRMLSKLGYSEKQILTADNGQISVDVVGTHTQRVQAPLLVFMVSRGKGAGHPIY